MNNYLEFATIGISIILFIILLFTVIRCINNHKKKEKDKENFKHLLTFQTPFLYDKNNIKSIQ